MDLWTTGMDYWNTGMDYWNMPVTSLKYQCMHAQKGYFNNGLFAVVASLSFSTT